MNNDSLHERESAACGAASGGFVESCCGSFPASDAVAVRRRDDSLSTLGEGAKIELGPIFSGEWTGSWTSRFALTRLFYVLGSGPECGSLSDSDTEIPLVPGTWAILPPWREIRHVQLPGISVVSVHFRFSLGCEPDPLVGCRLRGGIATEWLSTFLSISRHCDGEKGVSPLHPSALGTLADAYTAIWSALGLYFRLEGEGVAARVARSRPFSDLFAAVERAPERDFSVAEMAASVHMGASAFSRRFTETLGQPPRAWFNSHRARAAAAALLSEDATVREVSEKFGFCNEFYFSRFFKRHFGLSPANWRSQRRL